MMTYPIFLLLLNSLWEEEEEELELELDVAKIFWLPSLCDMGVFSYARNTAVANAVG